MAASVSIGLLEADPMLFPPSFSSCWCRSSSKFDPVCEVPDFPRVTAKDGDTPENDAPGPTTGEDRGSGFSGILPFRFGAADACCNDLKVSGKDEEECESELGDAKLLLMFGVPFSAVSVIP